MEYLVLRKQKRSMDEERNEFTTYEEAEKFANSEWFGMVESDRKNNDYFIILRSVNPNEEAEDHLDGDIVKAYKNVDR